ncbi:hypothetical protein OB988_21120 [Bacillus cereus]|uniref:Uncharacterized protein n=2 Tax=Bacillus cereus group TaxID=86661 RepID=A0A9X0SJE5_BACCE|nr:MULTISPECIES: hypothetical protein [Bacillus cereus group]EJR25180.1 hypothetical protein IIE_06360 [Bacillus cereus VD045]KXY26591.1 hypothetical protein AT268_06265 [Bacillus cereus]MCU4851725.1 hypothetical protein [Bacillus paranthracis]MCU5024966.1 hypothetical protein [Bacillus cereus]MDA2101379.1 hypothetical protein [Bacillus cereus]
MKISTFNAKTKKKRFVNAEEVNAFKVAYGKPLNKKDYLRYAAVPGLVTGVFSFLLLYIWWLSLILGVLGSVYGLKVLMPNIVKRAYERDSYKERNKFVNNMTSLLSNENKTLFTALDQASERAEGELRGDLKILMANILGADQTQVIQAFKKLSSKYREDITFDQYLEQLETCVLEGRTNLETLKDIKTHHNETKEKKDEYERKKEGHLKDMKMLCGVIVVFVLAITFSFGFKTYITAFARHPIGWIASGIYMSLMFFFFKSFTTYLFDDSIMEVKA